MKIVIANGTHEADFIIKKFKSEKHDLIIINNDKEFGSYISNINRIPVIYGDPTKAYVLDDANAFDCDVFIALSTNDIDNYVSCITAKILFHAKRVVCVVRNPKRVQLFRLLGIDSVISSTYLLGENIKNESIIEEFMRTITIENEKIMITELVVDDSYSIAHKMVREAKIPPFINISCIYRDPQVIIVNGDTIIMPDDRLVIVTTPEYHEKSLEFIQTKVEKNGVH